MCDIRNLYTPSTPPLTLLSIGLVAKEDRHLRAVLYSSTDDKFYSAYTSDRMREILPNEFLYRARYSSAAYCGSTPDAFEKTTILEIMVSSELFRHFGLGYSH